MYNKKAVDKYRQTEKYKVALIKRQKTEKYKEYMEKYFETNWLKYSLRNAKARAKEKGMEFNLSEEDVSTPAICPILLIPIIPSKGGKTRNSPSLDRIDNSKGYTKDNVRVISIKANMQKSDCTIEDVERLLKYMKKELN